MYQTKEADQSTRDMMANQEKYKVTAIIFEEGKRNPTCTESYR